MQFNAKSFNALREDINEALKEVEEKHGISLKAGNISYGDLEFTIKLNGVNTSSREDGEKEIFARKCRYYGLTPEDFGKEFMMGGKKYTIAGINTKARTNTIIIKQESNGKKYVMDHVTVRTLLQAA